MSLLLMAPDDLRCGLDQRGECVRVERLRVLLVATHRPRANQRGLALAVQGHRNGPAVVVLVLDDFGGPAVV
jgi:hypothetical protein